MKTFKEDIKNKTFEKIYLFYGEEEYLKKYYLKTVSEILIDENFKMMNIDNFSGKNCSVNSIYDAFSTMPFMSANRLVIINDSNLFYTGRKDDSEKISSYIDDIPESSVVIFLETQVDKRGKLYKKLIKLGKAVEFKSPDETELVAWVKNIFKKHNKIIGTESSLYLLRSVAHNMDNVMLESTKLIDYKVDEVEIKNIDIDMICSKSLETKVFDLVGAVGNKKTEKAISIYQNLIMMKEQPIVVLSLLARQFRIILQILKLREKNYSNNDIAEALGIRSFVVNEGISQARNFTHEKLISALKECLKTDIDIKTGKLSDKLAVEILIIKYSSS